MFKLFENKKAFNDVTIVSIILFIFLGTALVLPFINSEFETSDSTYNINNTAEIIEEEFTDVSSVKTGDIVKSIGKIFFWTFGELPVWLDLIFVVLRIILLYILIKTFTPFISGGA